MYSLSKTSSISKKLYKLSINYDLFVLCLSGFLYQAQNLLTNYWSGTTVVSIKVERLQSESLPGLTLCIPVFFSYERVAENKQEFNQMYQDYIELVNRPPNRSKPQAILFNKRFTTRINEMESYLRNLSGPLYVLLTSYSIPVDGFELALEGFAQGESSIINLNQTQIIESILLNYVTATMKCFTIFSHLSKMDRVLKVDMKLISIKLSLSHKWLDLNIQKSLLLSIHSPNSLPDLIDDGNILFNIWNELWVVYNQITTELLDSRYDTNCFEYDLDYKFANFNMRSDCISNCIQSLIEKDCNEEGFVTTGYSIRENFLERHDMKNKYKSDKNYDCHKSLKLKAKHICKNKYKPDCIFRYYSFDKMIPSNSEWHSHKFVKIYIQHNSLPDIVLKYLPQTTFLSLVCNFGGLLGMWLGLSFFNILDKIVSILKKMYHKSNTSNSHVFQFNTTNNNLFVTRSKPRTKNKLY